MPHSIENLLYASADVRVGTFRCPLSHPLFRTAGPIEGYTIAFPRTAVWIRHEGERPFVADPTVVTVYNRGQPYVRAPLAADGDRVDWFSTSAALAEDIAGEIDPASRDVAQPFRIAHAPCDPALYRRQRLLLLGVLHRSLTPLQIEQEVATLVALVLRAGLGKAEPLRVGLQAQRDLVEAAKAELARSLTQIPTLRELAGRLGVSPFHLCRVFRRWTGKTLHSYVLEVRARTAVEALAEPARELSRLAHRLGFSSHSHFTSAFRRRMGVAPSRLRYELLAAGQSGDSRLRRRA